VAGCVDYLKIGVSAVEDLLSGNDLGSDKGREKEKGGEVVEDHVRCGRGSGMKFVV
jgi:hypothetical protein